MGIGKLLDGFQYMIWWQELSDLLDNLKLAIGLIFKLENYFPYLNLGKILEILGDKL